MNRTLAGCLTAALFGSFLAGPLVTLAAPPAGPPLAPDAAVPVASSAPAASSPPSDPGAAPSPLAVIATSGVTSRTSNGGFAGLERDPHTAPLPLASLCSVAQAMTMQEAFGRPVTSVVLLRFIGSVRALPLPRLVAAAEYRYDADLLERISAATVAECTGPQASVAGARAYAMTRLLAGAGLSTTQQSRLLVNLFYAAAATSLHERLAAEDIAAALAPLGLNYANLAIDDGAPGSVPQACAHPNVEGRVVDRLVPLFPTQARDLHQFGLVRVAIRLEPHGFLEYARLYSTTTPPASSLLIAAIAGVGASTYDAPRRSCQPVAGSYIFDTEFPDPDENTMTLHARSQMGGR